MMTTEAVNAGVGEPPVEVRPRIGLRVHSALPWLILPDGVPVQLLIDASTVRVPNTRSWFNGVVSQRGNLLPVFDLAHWVGFAPTDRKQSMLVAVGQGAHACALLCTNAPALLTVADTEHIDTSSEVGALAPFLMEHFAAASGAARMFDIQRWLAAAARQVVGNETLATTH
ncbi:MAG: hypothetical protein E6Q88_02760 [Lysobacteraceae bacterium]|nr:MAG: hypothetical protein E6Q88_02760 [Xanthomonadaceae bacterium]